MNDSVHTMSGKGKGGGAFSFQPPSNNTNGGKKSGGGFQFTTSSLVSQPSGQKSGKKSGGAPVASKLDTSISKFLTLLDGLDDVEFMEFREFVREEMEFGMDGDFGDMDELVSGLKIEGEEIVEQNHSKLFQIVQFIRHALPTSALAPDEKLRIPKNISSYHDYTGSNTVHVDEFLYTDEEVNELVDAGLLTRNYCTSCGSHSIQPLNFISHSFSRESIRWLLAAALPNVDGKKIVQLGSRIGGVLWMSYLFTHASKIIGIESNPHFVALSVQVANEFKMTDRVEIVHSELLSPTTASILETADVVILNNVFEWFMDASDLPIAWSVTMKSIKKPGTLIVTSPSIEESLQNANITNLDINKWVKKLEIKYPEPPPGSEEELEDDPFFTNCREINIYQVL